MSGEHMVWRRLAAAAVVLAIGALIPGLFAARASAGATDACAAATTATVAAADAAVVNNIYGNELSGGEVISDLAQVTGSADLIDAVAAGNRAAALAAVKQLVYHPGWHIVRLRVLGVGGRVLADVGGPYVIAPVSGLLRLASGAVVGSFVMSVQDDVGVTKLETRIVGDPIGIYVKQKLVASLGGRLPATLPSGPTVRLAHVTYELVRETYDAFPTGTLQAALLVAPQAATLRSQPCATVRAEEFGRVAERLIPLLGLEDLHGYAFWVRVYTGADVFVQDVDGSPVTSSPVTLAAPAVLPTSGTMSYQGADWLVCSVRLDASTIAYLLIAVP